MLSSIPKLSYAATTINKGFNNNGYRLAHFQLKKKETTFDPLNWILKRSLLVKALEKIHHSQFHFHLL